MSDRGAVVIGASAGVGRALAEQLAQRGYDLVLVAQDLRDLDAVANDLSLRFTVSCSSVSVDLSREDLNAGAFLGNCLAGVERLQAVLYVAGYIDAEDDALAGDTATAAMMNVNYANAVRILGTFAAHFEAQGSGCIVGFSSIAASTPRGRNMVYASAKAGLETYLRALRHYFVGKGVVVQCYALGYVDTAMTAGKKLLFPKASPLKVAVEVADNLERDRGLVYFPGFWRWVTWVLRRLPWFVYRRLSF